MISRMVNRLVTGLLAGLVVLAGGLVGASALGWLPPQPSRIVGSEAYVLAPPEPAAPAPGLPSADAANPDLAGLQTALSALGPVGSGSAAYCVSGLSSTDVVGKDGAATRIPASSWKILTTEAALDAYGPDHRWVTKVVDSPDGIILAGGGDPFLTAGPVFQSDQATAQGLADQVASALKAAQRTTVTLGYDDSLFAGPQWNPDWPASWAADVAPISALAIDPAGDRWADTALDAATTFKRLLTQRGITVRTVRAERAGDDALVVGEVASLPLGQIVARVINRSDNFGAETLFRHVSLAADGDGSTKSAQLALEDYLVAQDLWSETAVVVDGSGLSMRDAVSACALVAAIRLAYHDTALVDVLVGMPVAGVDGTLKNRFDDPAEAPGRGVVRAKTGTNDHVLTLSGFTQSQSGAIVVFSFILNDLDAVINDPAGLNWLDEAAATLASA